MSFWLLIKGIFGIFRREKIEGLKWKFPPIWSWKKSSLISHPMNIVSIFLTKMSFPRFHILKPSPRVLPTNPTYPTTNKKIKIKINDFPEKVNGISSGKQEW